MFANRAMVLVGEACRPTSSTGGCSSERVKDAEQRLGEAEEGSAAYDRAERDKERAEAFLEVAGSSS